MDDVYVLDRNLEIISEIDEYKSLIWASRYNSPGDCELYIPASAEAFRVLQNGYYIIRTDDSMVCQINYIELDTSVEEGDYIIVKGKDVKAWLDQRIVWQTMNADGNAEAFIRDMVDEALGDTSIPERQIQNANGSRIFYLGTAAGFTEALTEQVSYKNIGDKVRDYCRQFGWGYRVILNNGLLYFELYKGTDRSDSVFFSEEYENLSTTSYVEDCRNIRNVALVGGQGEGSERVMSAAGSAESDARFEAFVDAKSLSSTMSWAELTAVYPTQAQGGEGYISGTAETGYKYYMSLINIQVLSDEQLAELRAEYPAGQEVTIDGNLFYQVEDAAIAELASDDPQDNDSVNLLDVIYKIYLLTAGFESLAGYNAIITFNGAIDPTITFTYKEDYFLGDIVTISNNYGISVAARIIEVVEVNDDNGYRVEPKYEYIQED